MAKCSMSSPGYTSLDLFSGAGGFSLGLEAAGFCSLGAVDIDTVVGKSYVANFGARPVSLFGPESGDMRKVNALTLQRYLDRAGVANLDLLIAGPPCQGFSRVGRAKIDSVASRTGAFFEDERNGLFRQAVIVLKHLRPRVFVFENVAGMLHLRGRNMAEAVCDAVTDAGYAVRAALLNSAWYGVPQTRERVFVIGVRDDLGVVPHFPPQQFEAELSRGHLSNAELDPQNWRNPEYFVPWDALPRATRVRPAVTAREALGDLPSFTRHLDALSFGRRYRARRDEFSGVAYRCTPASWYAGLMRSWDADLVSMSVTDHFCRWTPRDFETFRRMEQGDRYPEAVDLAKERYGEAVREWERVGGRRPRVAEYVPPYSISGFPDKWRKLVPASPSWTVTAHLAKDTYSHIHYDARQARTISIREAARLQSFPDAFIFSGNMGDAFRQIGNAVPPLLARAIGETVCEILCALDANVDKQQRRKAS